jgi:hypothetical protein
MPATTAFLLSIVDTNWDESIELLDSVKIPLIFLLVLWILYFWVAVKKINKNSFIQSRKMAIAASAIFAVIVFAGYSTNYLKKVYPYDLIYRTYQVYTTKKAMQDGLEKIHKFRFEAQKLDSLPDKEVYLFVIGETGRYSSYSLNGSLRRRSNRSVGRYCGVPLCVMVARCHCIPPSRRGASQCTTFCIRPYQNPQCLGLLSEATWKNCNKAQNVIAIQSSCRGEPSAVRATEHVTLEARLLVPAGSLLLRVYNNALTGTSQNSNPTQVNYYNTFLQPTDNGNCQLSICL